MRVNTESLPLHTLEAQPFDLLKAVKAIRRAGSVRFWRVRTVDMHGGAVAGRVCALRKAREAIRIAHKSLRKKASKKGTRLQPRTLEFAKYLIAFTTFPEAEFSAAYVLQWYRTRWQVELAFMRFKALAQLGHLPTHDDESAKALLFGKLYVALLVEKLISHTRSISPWENPWQRHRPPSAWRDFRFMVHQATRAIEPSLPLSRAIRDWNVISEQLADPPRKRTPQLASYFD